MSYKDYGMNRTSGLSKHYAKVFLWMALGLALTALVAFGVYGSGLWIDIALSFGGYGSFILLLAQLVLVIVFSAKLQTLSFQAVLTIFFAYSALTGINFSVLPAIYDLTSMGIAFLCASLLFVNLAIIGYTTKKDLSRLQPLLLAGLITLVVVTFINFFLQIDGLDRFMNYVGVFVFMVLIAFDMQKVKHYYAMSASDEAFANKIAVYCALELYLDFVNIFLKILNILGKRKD